MAHNHMVTGLFKDSTHAGEAISELKEQGFTKDISLLAKDEDTSGISSRDVKRDIETGAKGGAATGAIAGGIIGLLAGASSIMVPGIGPLLAIGPITALWGLTGAATGALAGGLIGGLIDAGIPRERAETYQDAVKRGEVLVTVNVPHDREDDVARILNKHRVYALDMAHGE